MHVTVPGALWIMGKVGKSLQIYLVVVYSPRLSSMYELHSLKLETCSDFEVHHIYNIMNSRFVLVIGNIAG